MNEDPTKQINTLIDRMEAGDLTLRGFLQQVIGMGNLSSGIGPFVRPSTGQPPTAPRHDLHRTGVVVRIQAVEGAAGNVIEGVVKPKAVEFTQVFTEGEWNHEVVAGTARLRVADTETALRRGRRMTIAANQKFTFVNRGRTPWRFVARHPMWQPDTFIYEYQGQRIPGYEMWFELKSSPDDETRRPMYNVLPAGGQGTFVVTEVEPASQTLLQYYTDGANIVTMISGSGLLRVEGQDRSLTRGDTATVQTNEHFQLVNPGNAPFLVEVRPDTPRMWDPTTSFWETSPGQFVPGSEVWFEFVLPI